MRMILVVPSGGCIWDVAWDRMHGVHCGMLDVYLCCAGWFWLGFMWFGLVMTWMCVVRLGSCEFGDEFSLRG